MRQAIGELQLAGFRFARSYWGVQFRVSRLASKAIRGTRICRFCGVSNYWGIPLRCVELIGKFNFVGLFCPKLLGKCNFEVPVLFVLCQAIEDVQLVLPQAIGGSCFVSSYWGISICRGLRCVKLLGITMRRVLQAIG